MEFYSTNLPHNVSHGLYHEKGYDVAESHIDKIYNILFYGVSNLLKANESKANPTSFVVTDIKGKPIASATVEYHDNADDTDNPGNWSLTWSFDPEDIPENAEKLDLQNDLTHSYFRTVAGEKYFMKFFDRTCIITLLSFAVEQLYKWLDENAKEGEEVVVDLDGVFTAKVNVEDGKKIFAIIPSGEVKSIIKNDAAIDNGNAVR